MGVDQVRLDLLDDLTQRDDGRHIHRLVRNGIDLVNRDPHSFDLRLERTVSRQNNMGSKAASVLIAQIVDQAAAGTANIAITDNL